MLSEVERKLEDYQDQISSGKKIVKINDKDILIEMPREKEKMLAKRKYTDIFYELLEEGTYKTDEEMKEILRKRKIWTDKDQRELDDLSSEWAEALNDYIIAQTPEEASKAAKRHGEIRKEMLELEEKYASFMRHTIESVAGDVMNAHLVVMCTKYLDTDEPIWNTYEEYLTEDNLAFQQRVLYEFLTFYRGIPQVFLEPLPEEREELVQIGEQDGK